MSFAKSLSRWTTYDEYVRVMSLGPSNTKLADQRYSLAGNSFAHQKRVCSDRDAVSQVHKSVPAKTPHMG